MKRVLTLLLAAAAHTAAYAAPQADLATQQLAANCAACHGTDGHAAPGSALPGLAGMPAEALIKAMAEFKAGTRPATLMHQIAKGYSDAQIAQLAGYFAAQPRP
ncbi:MAG: c-type cytochrome [Betaproteobacteria bacterium]|nr:c-type cytochrome [Betaproteobacteria bacterium]